MSVDFKASETRKNLMRAFAGESQARNRYTFAASMAKKEHLHVVEAVFTFTAGQEKEHAEIFYNHLKPCVGENITFDAGYPVDTHDSVLELLRCAVRNEYEEYEPVYKKFGDTAREEGFNTISQSFYKIAEIEKTHGDRFKQLADLLEKKQLFVEECECGWMCLNCGHIHTGKEAPGMCPVCQHDQGYFIRLKFAPYSA